MISRLVVILSALVAMPLLNAAEAPALGEYAYGFPILLQPSPPEDFHSIEIPLVLYQSVTDPRLRDLGVYDATGQPVPRVLQNRKPTPAKTETTTQLRLFPLPSNGMATAEDIRLLLRREDGTTNLEFNTVNGTDSQQQRYLLDTEDLEQPLTAIEFDWSAVAETFVATVNIEGSQDLDSWTPIGTGAIAHLRGDAGDIQRRRVSTNSKRYSYLRVSITDMPDDWRLATAQGIQLAQSAVVPRRWTTLDVSGEDEDGGLLFELGGPVPIDRLQVLVAGNNSVVRGNLYYWATDHWVSAKGGVFYNLRRNSASVSNEPLAIAERRSPRWKLKINTGRSDGPVQLKLGWRPETLVFLAQGEGPYTLASGRAADGNDNFPQARLYGDRAIFDLALDSNGANVAAARLGSRQLLGGVDALTLPVKRNWQQGLLWGALILAVVVVGGIAMSLLKQLNTPDS